MSARFYRSILMAATAATTLFSAGSALAQVKSDFNGDGKADLVWRNQSTDTTVLWYMNGPTLIGNEPFASAGGTNWELSAVGDFDNNGWPDRVMRNTADGGVKVLFGGGGTTVVKTSVLPTITDQNWKIAAAGHPYGPMNDTIVWRNYSTGENIYWSLSSQGNYSYSYTLPPEPDTNWLLVGSTDFDNSYQEDFVWHNKITGENVVWLMKVATMDDLIDHRMNIKVMSVRQLHTSAPEMIPEAVADYTGDNCEDIILRNTSTGYAELWAYDCNLNRVSVSPVATATTDWKIGVH